MALVDLIAALGDVGPGHDLHRAAASAKEASTRAQVPPPMGSSHKATPAGYPALASTDRTDQQPSPHVHARWSGCRLLGH